MYPHIIRLRGPWEWQTRGGGVRRTANVPGVVPAPERGVILRRHFGWTAKLDDDEAVRLTIDGIIGAGAIFLNGQPIGRRSSPWTKFAVDARPQLKANNWLEIYVEPLPEIPFVGVAGGVELSIETRIAMLGPWTAVCRAADDGGVIDVVVAVDLDPACYDPSASLEDQMLDAPRLAVMLDDEILAEESLELITPEELTLGVTVRRQWHGRFEGLVVGPWRTRQRGTPELHDLVIQCRSSGEIAFERKFQVGFRTEETFPEAPTLAVDDATLWLPNLGESAETSFEEWSLAKYEILRLTRRLAPRAIYTLCDRAGLAVEHDQPPFVPGDFETFKTELTAAKEPLEDERLEFLGWLASRASATF